MPSYRQNLRSRFRGALQGRKLRLLGNGGHRVVPAAKTSQKAYPGFGPETHISDDLHTIKEESSSDCMSKLSFEESFADVVSMDEDISYNQSGLGKLLEATKVPENASCPHHENVVAYAVVYGGEEGSPEERFRSCIQTFVCANVDQNDDYDGGSSSFFFDSFRSLDGQQSTESSNCFNNETCEAYRNQFHLLSLQIISNSLRQILLSSNSNTYPESINFRDMVWVRIIRALSYNIEVVHDDEITGCSLKCLRLLHSLEPVVMKQLLQQSLMPYILYLKEYGMKQKAPLIESEASRLLKRAEIVPETTTTKTYLYI